MYSNCTFFLAPIFLHPIFYLVEKFVFTLICNGRVLYIQIYLYRIINQARNIVRKFRNNTVNSNITKMTLRIFFFFFVLFPFPFSHFRVSKLYISLFSLSVNFFYLSFFVFRYSFGISDIQNILILIMPIYKRRKRMARDREDTMNIMKQKYNM